MLSEKRGRRVDPRGRRQGGRKEALTPFIRLAFIPFPPPASRWHSEPNTACLGAHMTKARASLGSKTEKQKVWLPGKTGGGESDPQWGPLSTRSEIFPQCPGYPSHSRNPTGTLSCCSSTLSLFPSPSKRNPPCITRRNQYLV